MLCEHLREPDMAKRSGETVCTTGSLDSVPSIRKGLNPREVNPSELVLLRCTRRLGLATGVTAVAISISHHALARKSDGTVLGLKCCRRLY